MSRAKFHLLAQRCTTFTFLNAFPYPVIYAAQYRPWKLKTYLAFEKKATAVRFESYLKSGSGRAFCKRHFD